ncbi:uncharacterized protein LOC107412443 isoform X2 [Ziziphus jujuba]|uniref:Uncharacterized protein LOC107412443 isoform X2 n=1 Tax=Ziziphus jujuba TaxID=326968 RepID=A0ABM3IAN1_ZIZJJ|nr:uncharacterized protein LOC107412443 isoform X2 [Ziziphus jujuba]
MSLFHLIFLFWVSLSLSCSVILVSAAWFSHHFFQQQNRKFEQKTDRFWEFKEQTNSWVEVELPYDLVNCVNDVCKKVGSIDRTGIDKHVPEKGGYDVTGKRESSRKKDDGFGGVDEISDIVPNLPLSKRISLTKMSDTSIWITGQSGSIYERFWNGVQWVMAPHDLPISAGHAISVFIVNQTILALSESGNLYQMQLSESSQPVWVELKPTVDQTGDTDGEQSSTLLIKSGVVSHDGLRVYFCTKNGTLLELSESEPPRWENHGRPPGANVAAIADAATIRTDVVYTISSIGELYEYDRSSKPPWKKHIWRQGRAAQDASLMPSMGSTLHGLSGDHSVALFLLTKGGNLVERRLHQRKWKWVVHGSPKGQHLTSITQVLPDDLNEKFFSLFVTTSSGSVSEYRISKQAGISQENQNTEAWVNHKHPQNAKVARSVAGLHLQVGRIFFPLDDGRLAELHPSGLGGENAGPNLQVNFRRKATIKYMWSILDAPESEGWNAEYCTEERGPTNCIIGTKDELNDLATTRSMTKRRKGSQIQQDYLSPAAPASGTMKSLDEYSLPDNWINTNFRLRMMHEGRSFFLITDDGFTFEYLFAEDVWIWLRHEHSTAIKGALGTYNGSLYVVDMHGSVLIRERTKNELTWINCTALRKGKQVIAGPPWDELPGRTMKVTPEDALFFVSKAGRLVQLTVALRKLEWKDCRNPPDTKIACIIDKELFRENIVFVVGRNGRLYQYNKVTELWHEHYQSQHLVLSRLPGTAMRPSSQSLTGSLFMLSEVGGLVEYHWNALDGWNWVEHGTPHKGVTLVGSTGPAFDGNQLFLIGSDGNVYLRYMDQAIWKWKNSGFPTMENLNVEDQVKEGVDEIKQEVCAAEEDSNSNDFNNHCDPKVASIRPIPFSDDSVIFELKDGRLAEMERIQDKQWVWKRIIGTPTSLCLANYWTALAA